MTGGALRCAPLRPRWSRSTAGVATRRDDCGGAARGDVVVTLASVVRPIGVPEHVKGEFQLLPDPARAGEAEVDAASSGLIAHDVRLVLTADHGMTAKHTTAGSGL